jgi:hypothetical protein
MWDFSMGFAGVLYLKSRNRDFWTTTVNRCGLFLFGARFGHFCELVVHSNTLPNNACGGVVMHLQYPIFLAVLMILYRRKISEPAPAAK